MLKNAFGKSHLEMSDFVNGSQGSAHRSDYVWQYEYYDDEEPVSFEGLKAHKYSIVIGFWVGLAVFVIFMFFVLTLLTKTGAPHQDNPEAETCPRLESGTLDGFTADDDAEKAFSRPLLTESRSYFHFYITQDQAPDKPKPEEQAHARTSPPKAADCIANGVQDILQEPEDDGEKQHLNLLLEDCTKTDHKGSFVPHFNIPNFVNSEHASALRNEDLLYSSSETSEKQVCGEESHCDIH